MKISGAELVVESLKNEGIEVIFGYPGGAVIPLFDVLYSEPAIKVVLTRHEQAAIHAADGYARATGKVGVCIVTSGPGATNAVTGLATANFDSVPIVCIAGQVPRNMIGNDAFQEADTVGITRPITKHNYLVTERKDLGQILKKSFYVANTGKPGPVVIDIPKDIFITKSNTPYPEKIEMRGYNPITKGHPGQIKRAIKAFNKAKKPLFYIGGGLHIAEAGDAFLRILEKTRVPVASSLMGLSIVPTEHPLFLGMIGMHGTYAANSAITDADLIFGIGVRFDDRATGALERFAPNAEIIHVDIDPAAISRNVPVAIPIVGDAKIILEEMEADFETKDIKPWIETVQRWKKERPIVPEKAKEFLSPGKVLRTLSEYFPDALISTEVGQNQMWTALFYQFKHPRHWLTSGGLGTMGYGFPAAMGAQMGCPDKRVINVAGDGSIQMNIQELATVVHEGIPVINLILNNRYLGMVRQWQEMFNDKRYSSTCLACKKECAPQCNTPGANCPPYSPDFVKLAEAYGAVGFRATNEAEMIEGFELAKKTTDRPVVLDFWIDGEANVWPMVPPGAGLDQMVFGPEEGQQTDNGKEDK